MSESTAVNPFHANRAVVAQGGAMAASEGEVQRAIAEVQAAVVMAKRFPRDPIAAMDRILQACARPTLAEDASYQYSKGGQDISGPSIRLAEVVAQNWGNMTAGIKILSSDTGKSECIAYAWDLETNFRDEKVFTVKHWRDTKSGGYAIKDEREIYELAANMGARRKRACILAVIPGDVIEAAEKQCELTLKTKIEITPEFIKSVVDAFGKYGVVPEQIEKRIQRRIDTLTPALAMQLRKIMNSLKDGMSQASDWFDPVEQADSASAAERLKDVATGKQRKKGGEDADNETHGGDSADATKAGGAGSGGAGGILGGNQRVHSTAEGNAPDAQSEGNTPGNVAGAPQATPLASVIASLKAAKTVEALDEVASLIDHPAYTAIETKAISATYLARKGEIEDGPKGKARGDME